MAKGTPTNIQFSAHGVIRMIERDIDIQDVIDVVNNGDVIMEYLNDKPYPSRLLLGWTSLEKPLHVVAAYDTLGDCCIVITAYWPDRIVWSDDYKAKK